MINRRGFFGLLLTPILVKFLPKKKKLEWKFTKVQYEFFNETGERIPLYLAFTGYCTLPRQRAIITGLEVPEGY